MKARTGSSFDTTTWTEDGAHQGQNFKQPQQVVFFADGSTAFVTTTTRWIHGGSAMAGHAMPGMDGTASLVVVNVKTRKIEKAIPLGKNLTGMGTRARK